MVMDGASQPTKTTNQSLSRTSHNAASTTLNLPQMYAKYVAANSSAVSQVESALRSLTYLLPGARVHDSELASESLHSFIQLVSIYHDYILKNRSSILEASGKTLSPKEAKNAKPKPSHHARYTMFWSSNSTSYTRIATVLKITEYTELLWEMLARRRGGEQSRLRTVVLLESLKAVCRIILLRLTNQRPLVNPPLPQREDFAPAEPTDEGLTDDELKLVDDANEFDARSAFGDAGVPTPPLSESEKTLHISTAEPYEMPRTGSIFPTLPRPEMISSYLLSHIITAEDVKPAKQLLHRLTTLQGQIAELLYILRPVIYAILVQRMARKYGYEGEKWKKNWSPWIAGISIDYIARALARRDLQRRVRSGMSALEREEFTKRGWNITWWGMRGAFYENVTKRYVHGFAERLRGKPLLDLVGGVVEDYEFLWSNYYFSTSTM